MLKQVLETMQVEPELLDLLNEDQRQLLFRKMREEQLRKWQVREAEQEKKAPKRTPKKIQFLTGSDGQPWTWVMGEHSSDLPYEDLVRQRERGEREREEEEEREMRKEAEELAKQETSHILALASKFGETRCPSPMLDKRKSLQLDEGKPHGNGSGSGGGTSSKMRLPIRRLVSDSSHLLALPETGSFSSLPRTESQVDLRGTGNDHTDSPTTASRLARQQQERLQRDTISKQVPIVGKTKEEQKQFQQKRAEELFANIKRAKEVAKRRAQEVSRTVEESWKQSEKKAKEFELTRRMSFNKARRLSLKVPAIEEKHILEGIPEERKKELEQKMLDHCRPNRKPVKPARPAPSKPLVRKSSILQPGTRPKTQSHVVAWFREQETPRGACREKDGSISLWFHGRLGRDQATAMLSEEPVGSYLVRLSPNIWGYTISVKTYTEVKHFLVDVSSGQYNFLGNKLKPFPTLASLLHFYRQNPITTTGQEVLLVPVPQSETAEDSKIFQGLFRDLDFTDSSDNLLEPKFTYL